MTAAIIPLLRVPEHPIVLVTGGRDFDDVRFIYATLDRIHARAKHGVHALMHGAARGADRIAGMWARRHPGVLVWDFPADWETHGKRAGPIRNAEMVRHLASADAEDVLVIAFPGGKGTADMCRRATAAGLRVISAAP